MNIHTWTEKPCANKASFANTGIWSYVVSAICIGVACMRSQTAFIFIYKQGKQNESKHYILQQTL